MEKNRQVKILSIIALVLAITGMTLGFAAFSTTLNIASSASVSPNSDDFNIKIYGIDDFSQFSTSDYKNPNIYTSSSLSLPLVDVAALNVISADNAVINGHSLSVSSSFSGAGENYVSYYFMIQNEGQYDAKVYFYGMAARRVCTALEDTQQKLVDAACPYFSTAFKIVNENGDVLTQDIVNSSVILKKGERFYLVLYLSYDYVDKDEKTVLYADGPFKVSYRGFDFKFTSAIN